MQIEFWGGPKDGEVIVSSFLPDIEYICMEHYDTPVDAVHFYTNIATHAARTQKYHRYLLASTKRSNYFVYIYSGMV